MLVLKIARLLPNLSADWPITKNLTTSVRSLPNSLKNAFSETNFLARKGLYLEDIFVLPEYRHRGIGKKMMNYLAAKAVADGCGRFEWSVLDWNQPAIDFYESIGATVMQEWRICRLTGEKLEQFAQKALAK